MTYRSDGIGVVTGIWVPTGGGIVFSRLSASSTRACVQGMHARLPSVIFTSLFPVHSGLAFASHMRVSCLTSATIPRYKHPGNNESPAYAVR